MWEWFQIILEAVMIVALLIAIHLLKRLEKSMDESEEMEGASTYEQDIERGKK